MEGLTDKKEVKLQLAYLYQHGLGGLSESERAMEIYKILADTGDVQGMYYLASLLLERRQLDGAADYYQKSAELGHVSGAYWAAALHEGLYGHPRDDKKYQRFIQHAARLGHLFAKRDIERSNMRNAKNLVVRTQALLRYFLMKIKGLYIVIRNSYDLRLR
ncbi:MAG: sel1 repeat family protein [Burkholderiales bacterium]|jgi:TPR repeat protein|nr:sel1 repeat family protein [Burkholderiales bacterium]